jgi:hypothetical protein
LLLILKKEINNYFYKESPFHRNGPFFLMYFVSNKWCSKLAGYLSKTNADLCIFTKAFHDYGIVIIDEFTFSSIIQLNGFYRPKLTS